MTRHEWLTGLANTWFSVIAALSLQLAMACGGSFSGIVTSRGPSKSITICRLPGSRGSAPMRVAMTRFCESLSRARGSRTAYRRNDKPSAVWV